MSKIPQNNKGRFSVSVPRETEFLKRRRQFKSKTIKNEEPDKLISSISSVAHPEKLLNIRKNKRRMSQLEKNIDLPDNLLAMDEFKETKIPSHTHNSRKFRASCLNPDLPDFLEPIKEITIPNLSKPYELNEIKEIKEEAKNKSVDEESVSKENSKENNVNDNNIEKEWDKLEEKKKEIEEEKRKLNEEKKMMEEKRILEEKEKKIKEEKMLEEQNKIKLEYEKFEKEKKKNFGSE